MDLKPGMIIITQGTPKSIISRFVQWATGSWWTHCFTVISDTESVEAWVPRVRVFNTKERLNGLERTHRDYVVMDLPGITDDERLKVRDVTESYIGTFYHIWNVIYFFVFHKFIEKGKRVFCSELVTRGFMEGIGVNIFYGIKLDHPEHLEARIGNMEDGFCSPDELFRFSDLRVVYRFKA